MELSKSFARKNAPQGAIPALTPWTFVRAASVANLLVAPLMFGEFSVIAIVNHDSRAFQMALWLVPFVTLVIWVSATLLYVGALTPRWIWTIGRRIRGQARSSTSDKAGVWDDWLDNP